MTAPARRRKATHYLTESKLGNWIAICGIKNADNCIQSWMATTCLRCLRAKKGAVAISKRGEL
jgi:hypothetical protein